MPLAEQTTASFDKVLGWPSVASETLPWERDPDELVGIPKSRRRKILPTYEAAVPAHIAEMPVALPDETHNRLAEVSLALVLDDDLSVEGILRLPDVLVEQPVVDSAFIAARLGVTRRAATSVIEKACGYGMLRPIGNRMRGEFYQADELIDVLEEISDMAGIRRVLATGSV